MAKLFIYICTLKKQINFHSRTCNVKFIYWDLLDIFHDEIPTQIPYILSFSFFGQIFISYLTLISKSSFFFGSIISKSSWKKKSTHMCYEWAGLNIKLGCCYLHLPILLTHTPLSPFICNLFLKIPCSPSVIFSWFLNFPKINLQNRNLHFRESVSGIHIF